MNTLKLSRILFWTAASVFGVVVSVPVLFFLVSTFGAMPFNNFYLHKVENFYKTIKHPDDSQRVIRMKEVGHYGNSNVCDFLVGDFRTTALTIEALKTWYGDAYPELFSSDLAAPYLEVSAIEGDTCPGNYGTMCRMWVEKSNVQKSPEAETLYLVAYADHSYSAFGDIRCH